MHQPILQVSALKKSYGEVSAIDGVDLSLVEGRCFGLLGPNGAGKTTTVEIMEGVRRPTSGTVRYRGRPLARRFRAEMGIQFQTTALPEHLTVREVLILFRSLYRRRLPLDELVDLCHLGSFLDRDTRKLSGGQRQRVLLALALVNDPTICFLDEPTTGLDPQSRRNFWDLVEKIKAAGTTILLTTHYMDEAYILCDEIAIMDQGRIIAQGPPEELLKNHFDGVRIRLPAGAVPEALPNFPWPVFRMQNGVEIQTTDVDRTLRDLSARGVHLGGVEIRSQTLEDLFLDLTGRQLRG